MHSIQAHILKKLTLGDHLRYRDLKPAGVESNRFVYHLKKLADSGYLNKDRSEYKLSALGKRYVDKLSLENFIPRTQPKIVTMIVCQNKKSEYLFYRHNKQPFFGLYCFPYGKIHFGETVNQAVNRELMEKAGISAKLKHCGEVYLLLREEGEIVSHMLCHIFYGTRPEGKLSDSCQWSTFKNIDVKNMIPGTVKIVELINSNRPFFEEINV